MTSVVTERPAAPLAGAWLVSAMQSRWLWCCLALIYLVTVGLGFAGRPLDISLGDSDDATRLLQVRAFMAGAGWYDLTIGQLGGTPALVSHWSRLLDVPLALGIGALSLVGSADRAELLVRAYWPALVLLLLLRVVVHEADARGGTRAAFAAVALGVTALTGLLSFKAGRIDHHNVMVVATVAGVLLMTRGFDDPRRATIAGALLGFALVIGYEPLALIAPLAMLAAVSTVWQPKRLAAVHAGFIAMTLTLAVGVMVSRPPSDWATSACDAISINLVLLVGCVATALMATNERGRLWSRATRLLVLAVGGVLGASLYGLVEATCIGGPYGAMTAEAKRLWLVDVIEAAPITRTLFLYPLVMIVFITFASLAASAGLSRVRATRTVEATATLIVLVAAIGATLLQMKFMPYATFLAAVVLAVFIGTRSGTPQLSAPLVALVGVVAVNQITLSAIAMPLAGLLEARHGETATGALTGHGCEDVPSLRTLDALPQGVIAAHVNFGPFIAASSHHRALAAPYHRIGDAIVAVHHIFTSPPTRAEVLLRGHRVDYVLHCQVPATQTHMLGYGEALSLESLAARLAVGDVPAYLQPVLLAGESGALRVYRVLPTR